MTDDDFDDACLGDHDRVLNITQLIGLSLLLGVSGGALAKAVGLGWGASLLIAWATTIVGIFAVTGVLVLIERLADRAARVSGKKGLIDAWDEDLWEDSHRLDLPAPPREALAKTGS